MIFFLQESCIKIKTNLNRAETNQAVLRALEARDRSIMENNSERVTTFSILSSLVLISVGLIQVYMVKTLFDDNSAFGKVLRGSKN